MLDATRTESEREGTEARAKLARQLQAAWGCPAAGHVPPRELPAVPPFALAPVALAAHRVTGTEPTGTCPLACLRGLDERDWVVEITRAAAVAEKYHRDPERSLGRGLTCADEAALVTLLEAGSDALSDDMRRAEENRKHPSPKPDS